MQTTKYGVRYQNATGDCVWTSEYIGAAALGKWVLFSPSNDGLAMGDTREACLDEARGVVGEEFDESEIDPVASEVNDDSLLTGQVEAIEEG